MKIRVRVSNHQQFGRLARRLREAEVDADPELRRAAPAVLAAVQAAVRGSSFPAQPPSRRPRGRSTGLRQRLAEATTTQPLASPPGVRFTVEGAVIRPDDPRGGHALARHSDATVGRIRWRHLIPNGDPENGAHWFNQKGDPWFFATIAPFEPQFTAAVERQMDRVVKHILR